MARRSVVVTGVGAVAAPGIGMDDLWKGLQQPPGPAPRLIESWDPEPWIPKKDNRRLDRFSQFALVAADEALGQMGTMPDDLDRVNVAFFNVNAVISLGLFAVGTLDLWLGAG